MAVVALTLTLFDEKDAESTVTLYTTDSFNLVALANAARAVMALIGGMVTGGFRPKARISVEVDLTVHTNWLDFDNALAGSDVEEGLFYQFDTANISSIREGRIPTVDELQFIAGSREVDETDADWIAFETAMLSGVIVPNGAGNSTVTFTDKYGNDLTALRDAYEQFAGSRAKK